MTTWGELNGQVTSKPTSNVWDSFNKEMSKTSIQEEAKAYKIDPQLYSNLKQKGVTTEEIQQLLPKKTSYLKSLVDTTKETFGGLLESGLRAIRGTSQVAATPIAGALALPSGGATPMEAMKESLTMAKDIITEKVSIDKGVEDAAQMWLKNRGVGKYGGKDPDIADVAALGMLGMFNLFGDPAFEFGVGLKATKALKEFATFKKVGQVTKELPEGAKIIQGIEREIPITEDLKIKIKPKENEVVFQGYKRRFPTQKALPDNQLSKETQDLIVNTREATGMELQAKFIGDDLVMKPTTPIKTTQPTIKVEEPLIQEAKKYKSAEEFVKAQGKTYYRATEDGKTLGTGEKWAWTDKKTAESWAKRNNVKVVEFTVSDEGIDPIDLSRIKSKTGTDRFKFDTSKAQTKSQLIDIWNKAQEKVQPTTKKSTLGVKIAEKTIEEGLAKRFQGIPEYEVADMKEQAQLAKDLLESNFEKAKKIAMGEETPEGKLLPESVFVAVEDYARKTGDIKLLRQLAKSHTVEQATFMGQRIRALGEREPNSPVKIIRDLSEARAKKANVSKKELTAEEKKIQQEIKKVKKTEKDLEDFINSIVC